MLIVITLCAAVASAAPAHACDRIAQPVDNCSNNSYFLAQAILAKTQLYDGTQQVRISCERNEK